MLKCFAFLEKTVNGVKSCGCEALSEDAFRKVQAKRGGCCMKNCPFFKVNTDQIRTEKGMFYLTDKQKRIQHEFERKRIMS